jgi:hypothetical protein
MPFPFASDHRSLVDPCASDRPPTDPRPPVRRRFPTLRRRRPRGDGEARVRSWLIGSYVVGVVLLGIRLPVLTGMIYGILPWVRRLV